MRSTLAALASSFLLAGCGLEGALDFPNGKSPDDVSPASQAPAPDPSGFDVALSMTQNALTVERGSYVIGRVDAAFSGIAAESVVLLVRPEQSVVRTATQVMPGQLDASGPAVFSIRPSAEETPGDYAFYVDAVFGQTVRTLAFQVTISQ